MRNQINILGEDRFFYEVRGELVLINHPTWSTIGCGKGLQEAQSDLFNSCKILKEVYCGVDDSELSDEAIKLKHWLLPIRFE